MIVYPGNPKENFEIVTLFPSDIYLDMDLLDQNAKFYMKYMLPYF